MSNSNLTPRRLGKNGPLVPTVGLGLMGMSVFYGTPPSDEERFAVLDRALELGATHWDTSDYYGDCESLLGKWFKRTGKRDEIFLATKFGFVKNDPDIMKVDSSVAYARQALEESLKTLGTDYVDLYYMHRANPETPIEKTARVLAEFKAEGKIKYIGLSEISSATLRRASKIVHIDAVQMEYSLFNLEIEGGTAGKTDLLATCRELGTAVVAYSPLGRGLLTGAVTEASAITKEGDWRSMMPWFSGDNLDANAKLVRWFTAFAERKGCTTAQLAIAWLARQGDDIFPIPGTKRVKYLEENWGALSVELTDEEVLEMRRFAEMNKTEGYRVADGALKLCYVDTVEE